jgi:hypothetical protein
VPTLRSPGSLSPFITGARRGAHAPDESLSVVALIRTGTLDADLASLLWLLLEGRVPLVVASVPRLAGKTTVLEALLAFLPPTAAVRRLEGFDEDFGWLPDAARLGWRREAAGAVAGAAVRQEDAPQPILSPASGYLIADELSPHLPWYTWGEQARVAVRALSLGYGLGTTAHADSLQELLDSLKGPDIRLTDDELSHLGVVLIVRPIRLASGTLIRRVVAAHYIRPSSRDAGGHVQRLAPAVLSTWDGKTDRFEDFSWGVTAELAGRVGRTPADFDADHTRRRDVLAALAAAAAESPAEVRKAIEGYRITATPHRH